MQISSKKLYQILQKAALLIGLFGSSALLTACEEEKRVFQSLNNPYGGAFAIRIPDQLKVNDLGFTYEISIRSKDGSYQEDKSYQLERMNFHPFNKEVEPFYLQYLHIEFFTLPQDKREAAYEFLSEWDKRISVNKDLFELETNISINMCFNQKIDEQKQVLTLWHKKNKGEAFDLLFDNLGKNPDLAKVQYNALIPC